MKTAIITGASSGMGREALLQISDRFGGIEEIWAVARRKDRMEELRGQIGVPLRVFALDLADRGSDAVLKEALEKFQPDVKLLVNAAGFGKIGPAGGTENRADEKALEEETGMVAVNCEAMCAVTNLVLPYMSGQGRILQFASSAAFLPQPGFAVYAATKAFVLSYSRALNAELHSRGIVVTAVCPGPVRTEFFQVAETGAKMPFYKNLFMARPRSVVKTAIRDSMMGKSMSVYGVSMKAFCILSKVIPHSLLLRVMQR